MSERRQNGMRKTAVWLLAAAMTMALSGCGGSNKTSQDAAAVAVDDYALDDYAYDNGMGTALYESAEAYEGEADSAVTGSTDAAEESQAAAAQTGRKLIKTVTLQAETEQFDGLMRDVEQKVNALGGYIEEMSSDNGSLYASVRQDRYASMTIRIPQDKLDGFVSAVAEQSNIVSRSESVQDITLQYVDMESHRNALQAEYDRLLELMERAETVEDIITIESRLSDVRYQIESMESQLRTYDNKIDYSTVYLYISEVQRYSPTEETTVWQRIRNGFLNSVEGVCQGISDLFVWVVIKLPYLLVWAIVIAAAVLILRAIIRRRRRRRAEETARIQAAAQAQASAWQVPQQTAENRTQPPAEEQAQQTADSGHDKASE